MLLLQSCCATGRRRKKLLLLRPPSSTSTSTTTRAASNNNNNDDDNDDETRTSEGERINNNNPRLKLRRNLNMPWFLVLILVAVLDALPLDVSCVRLDDIYWNSSNPIFRIDNTDHIIDVNKNNIPFEYDQVNIICPVYPPNTDQEDQEQYIIYNVSKEEYDTCTITNPHPRIIAVCDKPHSLMYFTITFRSFTPQPGGLEFRPGQDYYFISTSSKEDLHSRYGGRCLSNNMRIIFKVCCDPSKVTPTPRTTSTTTTTAMAPPIFHFNNNNNRLNINNNNVPPVATSATTNNNNNNNNNILRRRPTVATTTSTTRRPSPPHESTPSLSAVLKGGGGGGSATAKGGGASSGGAGEVHPDKHNKKTESKDKHPNETGVKNEELVNHAATATTRHRCDIWWLLLILTSTTLATIRLTWR